MSAYRENPGIAARLADLRAEWAAAELLRTAAFDAIARRAQRRAAGAVALLVQVAMVAYGLLVPKPADGVLGLYACYVLARILAGWLAARAARARAQRLAGGAAIPAEPLRAIAYLERHSPASLVAAEGRRLEAASVGLHMLSGLWFAFVLCVWAAASSHAELRMHGFLIGCIGLHALFVLLALFLLARPAHLGATVALVTLALVVGIATIHPTLIGTFVFQAVLLVSRWIRVHAAVLQERAALC